MPQYRLECTDCPYAETLTGEVDDVLDRIDDHVDRTASGDRADGHFVEFEVVEW